MTTLKIGDVAPDFKLPCDTGEFFHLRDHINVPLILYFYPKDMTSGCTQEACDFRDALLHATGLNVVGISRDSVKSHQKFKEKYSLSFPLLADEEGEVCQSYGVWVEKSMYGKKYFGIERSTFLIGTDGLIKNIWRKVSVKNHVAEVLKALQVL